MNAHEMAQALGRRGGRARARRLSAEDKKRIASLGGKARATSIQAAQRVTDNFLYLADVLELQGGAPTVTRLNSFEHRLPGIYPAES